MPVQFRLYSVDKDSDCFIELKTLKIEGNIEIDLTKVLTKCCKTLVHLELNPNVDDCYRLELQHQLQSLNYLSISFSCRFDETNVKNLLSKCSGSLRTLKLVLYYKTDKTDYSVLLEQTLKITTLEIESDEGDIEKFLNKCPLIQNLTLNGHKKEVGRIILKDLRKLEFVDCSAGCVTSLLKTVSNSPLKSLHFSYSGLSGDMPVIPELDSVWLNHAFSYRRNDIETAVDQLAKLFPKNVQVNLIMRVCFITIY